ncbi:probable glycosyltransferase At5g03795 [Trifolium pratense]|uniref:probable glycosyltransferase At5g03795 n=1 Tax=Trifolium pratense TaxID=57577 RepID=UPI001E6903F7|nr:probable glycosyltransferase At5g03795 [Trifolium pratense]
MKIFLAILPLLLVAGFGILSIMSPKEIEEIEVLNNNHSVNFNLSSSTLPFPVLAIQTLPQSNETKVLNISKPWVNSSDPLNDPLNETELWLNSTDPLNDPLNETEPWVNSTDPLNETEVFNISKSWLNTTDPLNETKIFNISKPWLNNTDNSLNETYVPPPKIKQQRKFSILDRTEAGLLQARNAIREAINSSQTQDPDYVPIGPMYWNPKAFHRSYIEMEKQFKVFVYEEGEPPVFHNGPCKDIYSMEGNFIHTIEMNDQFITKDPQKAHVFFLPFSVVMLVHYVYIRDSHDYGPIRKTVTDYIDVISGKYPYWNRSLGADHFMLACHDWGPDTSSFVPYLEKNAIRVLCNANTSEKFNPAKDVSFPEINLKTGLMKGVLGGPSASKRSVLAFFAGGLHGYIRGILLDHWENKDPDMMVQRYLPKGVSYYEMLRKTKYCLCPSGYEVASPRVVEAIYTGCVPVLISDHYVPPFSDVLNWKSFSVEVSVKDIPKLKDILMRISPSQYIRMQRRIGQVRRHFEVHSPPKRFDVFHMILHSVWLRRLNFKVHDDDQ